jgi:hypothetical protein
VNVEDVKRDDKLMEPTNQPDKAEPSIPEAPAEGGDPAAQPHDAPDVDKPQP